MWGLRAPTRCITVPQGANQGRDEGGVLKLSAVRRNRAGHVRYNDLPKEVVASAKRVLLDTLACAFGAVGSEPANIAEKTIRKTFGDGNSSTIIGYPRAATVEGALFVNGVLVRTLDLNDTYIPQRVIVWCRPRASLARGSRNWIPG